MKRLVSSLHLRILHPLHSHSFHNKHSLFTCGRFFSSGQPTSKDIEIENQSKAFSHADTTSNQVLKDGAAFWKKKPNQKLFFESLKKKLGIEFTSDWNIVTNSVIIENGGEPLLKLYKDSAAHAIYSVLRIKLESINPEELTKRSQLLLLNRFERENKIRGKSDWLCISEEVVKKKISKSLIEQYGTVENLVKTVYPEFKWDFYDGMWNKNQVPRLKSRIGEIMSLLDHGNLQSNFRGFDFYSPSLSLVFDYRDHEIDSDPNTSSNDAKKLKVCEDLGLKLVQVPYTWNGSARDLVKMIHKSSPNTLPHLDFNEKDEEKEIEIPKIKEFQMSITGIPNWEMVKEGEEESSVWIAENYTGVRAQWSGSEFHFYGGKSVEVPQSFKVHLPKFPVDGILTTRRGSRVQVQGILLGLTDPTWNDIVFKVYDALSLTSKMFESRYLFLKQNLPSENPFVQLVPITYYEKLTLSTLEGVRSKYRSKSVLIRKSKSMLEDLDSLSKFESIHLNNAVVVSSNDSHITLKNSLEQEFQMNHTIDTDPLPVGSVITYKFASIDQDTQLPVNPMFHRYYYGSKWEEVPFYRVTARDELQRCIAVKCRKEIRPKELRISYPEIYKFLNWNFRTTSACCIDCVSTSQRSLKPLFKDGKIGVHVSLIDHPNLLNVVKKSSLVTHNQEDEILM